MGPGQIYWTRQNKPPGCSPPQPPGSVGGEEEEDEIPHETQTADERENDGARLRESPQGSGFTRKRPHFPETPS